MEAQVIAEFGDPDVFYTASVEEPDLTPGYVLVKVSATSVNPIDLKIRSGAVPKVAPELPAILHDDVAGTVVEVGEGVSKFELGDEVFGLACGFEGKSGALGEYVLTDPRLLAEKPPRLSMEQAAALPIVGITAWRSLVERAEIDGDESILVHGGTGGVGHIGVQLAHHFGATVSTTASTSEKMEIARSLGAENTINYERESVENYVQEYTDGDGFDVVFDTVGGENIERSFQAVKPGGTVVTIAARSKNDLTLMHQKDLTLHAVFILLPSLTGENRESIGEILDSISSMADSGEIRPLLDKRRFEFNEVSAAHRLAESGGHVGKVVITNGHST